MSEEFELDWLDLREPHDAMARSEALAEALIARLPARPRLMDLGAGTGSLFRWLAPRIGRAQAWTLVDQNKEMTEAAFDTIADRAETVGLKVTFPNRRTLLVHAPGGAWRVEALIADLAHAPGNLPVGNVDAVVCSALCDLVSAPWVERMAAAIRVPFYACLNVDGRDRFLPPVPGDALVARGFARDQGRDKGFGGRALGPKAVAEIARVFGAQGFEVQSAASDWVLRGGSATALLSELVFGHAEARFDVAGDRTDHLGQQHGAAQAQRRTAAARDAVFKNLRSLGVLRAGVGIVAEREPHAIVFGPGAEQGAIGGRSLGALAEPARQPRERFQDGGIIRLEKIRRTEALIGFSKPAGLLEQLRQVQMDRPAQGRVDDRVGQDGDSIVARAGGRVASRDFDQDRERLAVMGGCAQDILRKIARTLQIAASESVSRSPHSVG